MEVNGFEEDITIPGGEDVSLSVKLRQANYDFGFEKEAIVYHDYERSLYSFLQRFYHYGYGCKKVKEKYFNEEKHDKSYSS